MKKFPFFALIVLACAVLLTACKSYQTQAAEGGGEVAIISAEKDAASSTEAPTSPLQMEPEAVVPTESESGQTSSVKPGIRWDEMSEKEQDELKTLVFNALKALDTEALAPCVTPDTLADINKIRDNPQMFAIYQNLMDRVTYEAGYITGPSLKYLLGTWWMEHAQDEPEAVLSHYAEKLFEYSYMASVVTYEFDLESCLREGFVDAAAVFHPLGIDPAAFSADPATALAAESQATVSGRNVTASWDGRAMEGYLKADLFAMLDHIRETQTDKPEYPALTALMQDVDLEAVNEWARKRVLVKYVGSNVYYYVPCYVPWTDMMFTYYELVTPAGLTGTGAAKENDIAIVEGILSAYNQPEYDPNPQELPMEEIEAALGFGYRLPDESAYSGTIVTKMFFTGRTTGVIELWYYPDAYPGRIVYVSKAPDDGSDPDDSWSQFYKASTEVINGVEVHFYGVAPERRAIASWKQDGYRYSLNCAVSALDTDIMEFLPLFMENE